MAQAEEKEIEQELSAAEKRLIAHLDLDHKEKKCLVREVLSITSEELASNEEEMVKAIQGLCDTLLGL